MKEVVLLFKGVRLFAGVDVRAKALRLTVCALHQVHPAHRLGKTGVVLDLGG